MYLSRRETSVCDEIVIDGIVFPALRFNREHDITGCLWVGKQHFVQVLEGPTEAVDPLFARIRRDARHSRVTMLERAPLVDRRHARFAMQLIRGEEHEAIAEVVAKWSGSPVTVPLDTVAVPASPRNRPSPGGAAVVRVAARLGRLLVGRAAF